MLQDTSLPISNVNMSSTDNPFTDFQLHPESQPLYSDSFQKPFNSPTEFNASVATPTGMTPSESFASPPRKDLLQKYLPDSPTDSPMMSVETGNVYVVPTDYPRPAPLSPASSSIDPCSCDIDAVCEGFMSPDLTCSMTSSLSSPASVPPPRHRPLHQPMAADSPYATVDDASLPSTPTSRPSSPAPAPRATPRGAPPRPPPRCCPLLLSPRPPAAPRASPTTPLSPRPRQSTSRSAPASSTSRHSSP
jgi:hypothetical protein